MPFVKSHSRFISCALAIAAIFVSSLAGAATYYVDSAAGNDANNGTSTSTPWRSIAKVNARSLLPGDTVLFKRGGFWRDQLNVTRSGTSSARITYGAYGTGNRPVFCASDKVIGWTVHNASANIWRAPCQWVSPAIPYFSTVDLAFVNGEVGIKRSTIAAIKGPGQWCYANGILYVYHVGTPTNVEVAKRNYGVYACDKLRAQYITVSSIEIKNANFMSILVGQDNHNWIIKDIVAHRNGRREDVEDNGRANQRAGFCIRNCDNTLITGCTVYLAGSNGIQVTGGSNNIIEHCTVYDAQHHCIDMKGSSSRTCTNNVIRYNTVYQRPQTPNPQHGIVVTDDGSERISNTKIYGNLVYGIHDIGMLIYGTLNTNVQVFNNTIYNCHRCYVLINMGSNSVVVKNNIGMTTYNKWHPVFSLEKTSTANKIVDYNCWIKKGTDPTVVQNGYNVYTSLSAWRSATGFDAHSVLADPLFVNTSGADFRLQASSPAINRATGMGLTVDKAGVAIPQGGLPDMGAYERPM